MASYQNPDQKGIAHGKQMARFGRRNLRNRGPRPSGRISVPVAQAKESHGGSTVEENLHQFLAKELGAFTTTTVPYFGFWRSANDRTAYDECRLYEVSFVGKERIPVLLEKLAEVALAVDEECIYFKAGQYACLVKPRN